MTAAEYADRIAKGTYTRPQFMYRLRAILRKEGVPYGNATYDEAGNCRVCGEAGRCPGVHTLDEIQAKRVAEGR